VQVPVSVEDNTLVGSIPKLGPLKPPLDLATRPHVPLDEVQGASAVKLIVSGVDELTLRLRPWIWVLETNDTPVAGDKVDRAHPVGAVRLKDPSWPLVGAIVKDVARDAPAGTLDGEIVPTTVPAADADGASEAVAASRIRTSGNRIIRLRFRVDIVAASLADRRFRGQTRDV
jgi:hypothetical protein